MLAVEATFLQGPIFSERESFRNELPIVSFHLKWLMPAHLDDSAFDLYSALTQVMSEHCDHLAVPQNLYLPVTATWAGDDFQDRASGNGNRRTVDVGDIKCQGGLSQFESFSR
jgi:hypothetical protein